MQKYAERVVRKDSLVMLENVLVHNFGLFGFAGRHGAKNGITNFETSDGDIYKFQIPIDGAKYIAVPELKGWWTFRAWLHEAGHSSNDHCDRRIFTYEMEYEAEAFCIKKSKKAKKKGIISSSELHKIKDSAYCYLISHMKEHALETSCDRMHEFRRDIVNFLPEKYKELLKDSLSIAREEKYIIHQKKIVESLERMAHSKKMSYSSGGGFYGG